MSTALMYSFAQRPDTRVIDEPLYAHYLRVSGADHPGREDVLSAQDNDGDRVVRDVILGECDRPILFMKQMAHHLVDLDLDFLSETINIILVRDPQEMLPSLINQLPNPTLVDTGLRRQNELYDHVVALGQSPPILDARQTLLAPEVVLERLCSAVNITYSKSMLTWKLQPRPEDGVWAKHWYHNVQKSSGFAPYRPKTDPFPDRLNQLLDEARPYYQRLYDRAIKTD